jgi:uncharacterized protein YneF (UPF0154 family)
MATQIRAVQETSKTAQGRLRSCYSSNTCSAIRISLIALLAALLASSCQSVDPIAKEKQRLLTPDERYLVSYYIKIIEVEKNLQDNPALEEEKLKEIGRDIDEARIKRTLDALEKKPEAWMAIYNRINELQNRALHETSTEKR